MQILNIFKKQYNGLQIDIRTESEKAKDWQAVEVYGELAPVFREVGKNEWLKYQVRNQAQSGSCVANTVAKMLEVMYFKKTGQSIKFSHAPIYIKRKNKPSAGMAGTDALDIAIKTGSCLESDMPSEFMNDEQLDALKLPVNFEDLNNKVIPTNYLIVQKDFNYVASLVNRLGAVMYWVDTNYSDWNKDIPLAGKQGGGVRHSITVVDAIKIDNIEYLVVEDSWGSWK